MKKIIVLIQVLCSALFLTGQSLYSPNIVLITADGLRWQEIFNGLDTTLLTREVGYETYDKYYATTPSDSRKKLMPFVWTQFVRNGKIQGNRMYGNTMNTKNFHRFSYPGYSEMLCGYFDPLVNSNGKNYNKNVSILEILNHSFEYAHSIAVFSSWEVFPYILNEPRSGIMVNSGWEQINTGEINENIKKLNKGNMNPPAWKGETRYDDLTWNMAMEYMKVNHPKVSFISLDDTDHFGHKADYPSYLNAINQFDTYLNEMWDYLQSDPFYRDNTYFIITTDHGRGTTINSWAKHGFLPHTSGEIWMMESGPTIPAEGEVKTKAHENQAAIAYRIAEYSNVSFRSFVQRPMPTSGKSIENSLRTLEASLKLGNK